MFLRLLGFELKYRAQRPATYMYFLIMFLVGFAVMALENLTVGEVSGQVKENAPTALALKLVTLTAIPGFVLSSAIMGVPVLRDFLHRTDTMIFTSPAKKSIYLWSRFLGSFIILVTIFLGVVIGMMIGTQMPWVDAEKMLPFNLSHYLQPFLVFTLPNLFVSGALFFMSGTLSRSMRLVFVQGIFMLGLYIISIQMITNIDSRSTGALLDMFGLSTLDVVSQYWTIEQQNTKVYAFEGLVLLNRFIWMAISILALVITYWGFNFRQERKKLFRQKKKGFDVAGPMIRKPISLPLVFPKYGVRTSLLSIWQLTRLYATETLRSIPFLSIVFFGILILAMNAANFTSYYGTHLLPKTYFVLELLENFELFFLIIIVFYTGELTWRERDLRMANIVDSLPIGDLSGAIGKFLGLVLVHVIMLLVLIITGVIIQASNGYYQFELGVYFQHLFTDTLVTLILYTMLGMFIQVMVNNKYLGYALFILVIISTNLLPDIGLEHSLFRFNSGYLGDYSEMNDFGHYFPAFTWYKSYWLGFAFVLLIFSVLFVVRGTESLFWIRTKLATYRFRRSVALFMLCSMVLFIGSGAYVYYNTQVVNDYTSDESILALRAEHEKTLNAFEYLPQPKIVSVNVKVDMYPNDRDFHVEGRYWLKNKSDRAISDIHIQASPEPQLHTESILFSQAAEPKEHFESLSYTIYSLETPLEPGDSIAMDFGLSFLTQGFSENDDNTDIVFNGTFFSNSYFPSLGYARAYELKDPSDRKKFGLPERERMRERNDPYGLHANLIGDDADHIRFEAILSTEPDQIAVAPGYLQRDPWMNDGRRYFHYKMDVPMFNYYALVSARYAKVDSLWRTPSGNDIQLEIYYHPGHEENLDRMMSGMAKALAYCETNFSPYQYRQMRILEFPRYRSFAESFANTIPYSEALGFITKVEEGDIDMPLYVTAHEMAHQWWGHQVMQADVKGSLMMSESLSQYTALMVMKQAISSEQMETFLQYELDRYLSGRRYEQKKEQPLSLVESQDYIHYNKGSLVMYALQDYIGEEKVNTALQNYLKEWAWRTDRYPTSEDLLTHLRSQTPDSLRSIIFDMFERITLFENRVRDPSYENLPSERFEVEIPIYAKKYQSDSLGKEAPIPVHDWIDIGVYGQNAQGQDSLIYLQKHLITQQRSTIRVEVGMQPTKAGIDPIHKLIDRNTDDNVQTVEKKEYE